MKLLEVRRSSLINIAKSGDGYTDGDLKGQNRYTLRTKCRLSNNVAQYNRMDLDTLFKKDILKILLEVSTDSGKYIVTVAFNGVIENLRKILTADPTTKIDFRLVFRALQDSFNRDDLYVACTCADWEYRFAYWSTIKGYNAGQPQLSNGKKIANPNDTKGSACKHVVAVLSNTSWLLKVAATISNYIKYMANNSVYQRLYAQYIFPALYGISYDRAYQTSIFDIDNNQLPSRDSDIDVANRQSRFRPKTDIKAGPDAYRIPKIKKIQKIQPIKKIGETNPNQTTLFDNEEEK
jgi:hypothetical protein